MPAPDRRCRPGQPSGVPVAERYRRFADREARGRSPLYERFALGVAGDRQLVNLLERLPVAKQQPNLLFAAVLYLGGRQPHYGAFRAFVLDHADQVVATVMARQTQTNEVGRCALLLPLLPTCPARSPWLRWAPAPGCACSQTATPTTTAARSWVIPPRRCGWPANPAGRCRSPPRCLRWCGAAASTWPPSTCTIPTPSAGWSAASGPTSPNGSPGCRPPCRSPRPTRRRWSAVTC
jgi:hypothetical protein